MDWEDCGQSLCLYLEFGIHGERFEQLGGWNRWNYNAFIELGRKLLNCPKLGRRRHVQFGLLRSFQWRYERMDCWNKCGESGYGSYD